MLTSILAHPLPKDDIIGNPITHPHLALISANSIRASKPKMIVPMIQEGHFGQ